MAVNMELCTWMIIFLLVILSTNNPLDSGFRAVNGDESPEKPEHPVPPTPSPTPKPKETDTAKGTSKGEKTPTPVTTTTTKKPELDSKQTDEKTALVAALADSLQELEKCDEIDPFKDLCLEVKGLLNNKIAPELCEQINRLLTRNCRLNKIKPTEPDEVEKESTNVVKLEGLQLCKDVSSNITQLKLRNISVDDATYSLSEYSCHQSIGCGGLNLRLCQGFSLVQRILKDNDVKSYLLKFAKLRDTCDFASLIDFNTLYDQCNIRLKSDKETMKVLCDSISTLLNTSCKAGDTFKMKHSNLIKETVAGLSRTVICKKIAEHAGTTMELNQHDRGLLIDLSGDFPCETTCKDSNLDLCKAVLSATFYRELTSKPFPIAERNLIRETCIPTQTKTFDTVKSKCESDTIGDDDKVICNVIYHLTRTRCKSVDHFEQSFSPLAVSSFVSMSATDMCAEIVSHKELYKEKGEVDDDGCKTACTEEDKGLCVALLIVIHSDCSSFHSLLSDVKETINDASCSVLCPKFLDLMKKLCSLDDKGKAKYKELKDKAATDKFTASDLCSLLVKDDDKEKKKCEESCEQASDVCTMYRYINYEATPEPVEAPTVPAVVTVNKGGGEVLVAVKETANKEDTKEKVEKSSGGSSYIIALLVIVVIVAFGGYFLYHNKEKLIVFVKEKLIGSKDKGDKRRKRDDKYSKLDSEEILPSVAPTTSNKKKFIY